MPADEIRQLAADMSKASTAIVPAMHEVFADAGDEVVKEWKSDAASKSSKYATKYPATITSETRFTLGGVKVEMGPEARGQGNLGRILELGTSNGNAPQLSGLDAVEAAEPDIEKAAETAIDGLLP